MQDRPAKRLPRHSDGGGTLPPLSGSKSSKKASRRKKGLGTISAPLTPNGSLDGALVPGSPQHLQQLQQDRSQTPQQQLQSQQQEHMQDRLSARSTTPSRLGRRNAQSDTGQPHVEQQQLFLQHSVSTRERGNDTIHELPHQAEIYTGISTCTAQQLQQQHLLHAPHLQQQQQQVQPHQHMLAGPPPPAGPPAHPQGPFSTGAPTTGTGAGTAAAGMQRPSGLQQATSLEGPGPEPPPTLWEFFYAEATPHEKYPTADVLWRQTERDRVYNFLLYVPYQLERIMIFGTLLCFYSFLGALTALPLRCLWAVWQALTHLLLPSRRSRQASSSSSSRPSLLPGAQLYDVLCALLMLGAVVVLNHIKPGVLYYWMKDITSEFLKIQVLFTALEILDKILSNFGVDVLEALSSTCTLYTQSSIGFMQLLSDLLVAFLLITAHGSVLMCQAMVFAVTMNSKRNALLALMIATNFVELKGQVYKRTDTNKLWALACQDIVERFQLLLVLCFVVVEDISNSGTWWPAASTLLECGRIFVWEIVIDITKHAVLGKFNDIRPGIYKEYMRDLCTDSLDKHSHNTHKLVGFCPLGPAALCLRMVHTLFTLKCDGRPDWHLRIAVLLSSWAAACATQVVLGYSLKWAAYLYIRRYTLQAGGKVLPRAINVTPSGIKLFAPSGPPPAAVSTAIKSSALGASGSSGQLHVGFDQRGVQSRVTGAAAAASGGSPVPGMSPLPSPKGNGVVPGQLAGQLAMSAGVFNSGSGSGRALTPPVGISSGSQQITGPGLLSYPGLYSQPGAGVDQVPYAGNAVGGSSSDLQSGHMQASSQAYVSGNGSNIDSSTCTSLAHQRLLAATLAANSAPPAASSGLVRFDSLADEAAGYRDAGNGLNSHFAGASSSAAAAGSGSAGGAWADPSLQTLSMPPRLGLSHADRVDSRPDSPFSASSQLQLQGPQATAQQSSRHYMHMQSEDQGVFATTADSARQAPARASCSDARPGWDADDAGDSLLLQGNGGTLAESMFTSKEAPAAIPAGPVMVAGVGGGGDSAGSGGAANGVVAGAGVSSSYSEVSAAGLAARGQQKYGSLSDLDALQQQHQQQQQRHAEQEWQQPKGRHRAKRE